MLEESCQLKSSEKFRSSSLVFSHFVTAAYEKTTEVASKSLSR